MLSCGGKWKGWERPHRHLANWIGTILYVFSLSTYIPLPVSKFLQTRSVVKSMRGDFACAILRMWWGWLFLCPLAVSLWWIRANLRWGTPNMLCMTGSIIRTCFIQCIQVIYYFQMSPNILQMVYCCISCTESDFKSSISRTRLHLTKQLQVFGCCCHKYQRLEFKWLSELTPASKINHHYLIVAPWN
jgi:hypothetical protein